jgi:hypothetical protein
MATDTQDQQIAADVDSLRERASDTRALYREVCALLFFRYGITPTANRLYQYVRKGSMNVPAEVLSAFWKDLRERTRVRIDHPGLPDGLRQTAGSLVQELWAQALAEANATYDAARDAAALEAESLRRSVAAAESAREALEQRLQNTRERLADAERELADARAQAAEGSRRLAALQGRMASMSEMLHETSDETRVMRLELAAAQRDAARAAGEANALRVQLALARRRGSRKPLGGVPPDPDTGQEPLELDPDSPELPSPSDPAGDARSNDDTDDAQRT